MIRLPGHVQLSDITLQHPPPTVAHTGGASSAPRDFAVFVSGAEARRWVGDFVQKPLGSGENHCQHLSLFAHLTHAQAATGWNEHN